MCARVRVCVLVCVCACVCVCVIIRPSLKYFGLQPKLTFVLKKKKNENCTMLISKENLFLNFFHMFTLYFLL